MTIRIFLADDHAVLRDGLHYLLDAQPDLQVVGDAGNGREAVRRCAQLHPDVALLDIAMPELNGLEAARQIRQAKPDTQVVILSMYSTAEHVTGALRAGAGGYVLKESAGLEVVTAVRSVHAGQRYLSQKITDLLIDDYILQTDGASRPLDRLTGREREVLQLVVEGHTSADIGRRLSISVKTVETYRSRIMHKFNLQDLPALIKFALQNGLISLDQ